MKWYPVHLSFKKTPLCTIYVYYDDEHDIYLGIPYTKQCHSYRDFSKSFNFSSENCWAQKQSMHYNSPHSKLTTYTYDIRTVKSLLHVKNQINQRKFFEKTPCLRLNRENSFFILPVVIKTLCWWLFSTHVVYKKGVLQLI